VKPLSNILFFIGYVLLFGPPRAIDLNSYERTTRGELKDQPLFIMLFVEFMVRSVLLLIIAVGAEQVMGDHLYETYRIDQLGFMLLVIGAIHSCIYYLLLGLGQPKLGWVGVRVYRLLRNLCYSFLPGIVAITPVIVWQAIEHQEPFSGELVEWIYLSTTVLMLLAGLIEAMLVKRRPRGLDNHLNV
jgi:putative effector of murein hydrolase LrgA (UPF0299 family)